MSDPPWHSDGGLYTTLPASGVITLRFSRSYSRACPHNTLRIVYTLNDSILHRHDRREELEYNVYCVRKRVGEIRPGIEDKRITVEKLNASGGVGVYAEAKEKPCLPSSKYRLWLCCCIIEIFVFITILAPEMKQVIGDGMLCDAQKPQGRGYLVEVQRSLC